MILFPQTLSKILAKLVTYVFCLNLVCNSTLLIAQDINHVYPELRDAGFILKDHTSVAVLSKNADQFYIPASTTKLVTAWLALDYWGENYRFTTHFYYQPNSQTLWIKASGDPYLVSEEIELIARNLSRLGIKQIQQIGLDTAIFNDHLIAPGAGHTINPYDAIPTALAANFNTIAIKKSKQQIISTEKQTPITATAIKIASLTLKKNDTTQIRINTGQQQSKAEHYFVDLLLTFLNKYGVKSSKNIIIGKVPALTVFYSHKNSKNLTDVIRPMMKYSTNFIANQLILALSAEYFKRPANFEDVQLYLEKTLYKKFKWSNFKLYEGAGLSRNNALTPAQLVEVLEQFRPWKHLLPEVGPDLYAKSGTLNGVSTLAGYKVDANNTWQAFALMMKQSVPHTRRNKIAAKIFR